MLKGMINNYLDDKELVIYKNEDGHNYVDKNSPGVLYTYQLRILLTYIYFRYNEDINELEEDFLFFSDLNCNHDYSFVFNNLSDSRKMIIDVIDFMYKIKRKTRESLPISEQEKYFVLKDLFDFKDENNNYQVFLSFVKED